MHKVSFSSGYSVNGRDFGRNFFATSNSLPERMPFFSFLAIAFIMEGASVVRIRDRSWLIGFNSLIALRSCASSGNFIKSRSAGEKKE